MIALPQISFGNFEVQTGAFDRKMTSAGIISAISDFIVLQDYNV